MTTAGGPARALGRGINLGNMLEAPQEGDWGLRLEARYFALAKEARFDTVRLPVRWSSHAAATPPYRIDESFFQRVDFAIGEALRHDLNIVVNMHHYRQLDGDPLDAKEKPVDAQAGEERFVAMWRQIAERYRSMDQGRLYFELYNEPHNRLTAQAWNTLLARTLVEVRAADPGRFVVIGPAGYSKVDGIDTLALPFFDRRIIVTVHLYEPHEFTHQGAAWVRGSGSWTDTPCCDEDQRAQITRRLDAAASWRSRNLRPVWVGEFGSYERADHASRLRYTRFMREEMEARGFPWAYWELASRFGIYDPGAGAWRGELRDALVAP